MESNEFTTETKKEFLQHMRQYRHDILNHVQLVKGYISMGKISEAQKHIDKMVILANDDANISELKDADLAYFLLTRSLKPCVIQVDVEFGIHPSQVRNCPFNAQGVQLLSLIEMVFVEMENQCQQEAVNDLFIVFQGDDKKQWVTLEMEGYLKEPLGETEVNSFLSHLSEAAVQIKHHMDAQQFHFCLKFDVV